MFTLNPISDEDEAELLSVLMFPLILRNLCMAICLGLLAYCIGYLLGSPSVALAVIVGSAFIILDVITWLVREKVLAPRQEAH